MEETCRSLPKVELHAHLSGSISHDTLRKYGEDISGPTDETLPAFFDYFPAVYRLINSLDRLQEITKAVIDEFQRDNVVYLELRTTPRPLPRHSNSSDAEFLTIADHLLAMLSTLHEACEEAEKSANRTFVCRLLVSINRSASLPEINKIIDATLDLWQHHPLGQVYIVGIDLSGDPKAGSVDTFLPGLQRAVTAGLPVCVHLAEISDEPLEEVLALLQLPTARIGHGTYLHKMGEHVMQFVRDKAIPIEICLTSNIKTGTVSEYNQHHLQYWTEQGHPICICSDDKGAFGKELSEELQIAAEIGSWSASQLWQQQMNALQYGFAAEKDKESVRQCLLRWKSDHLQLS